MSNDRLLKPYQAHGCDIEYVEGRNEAIGDCPFCGREDKFYINVETGLWSCKVCGEGSSKGGGNVFTFIRKIHELSMDEKCDYTPLLTNRKLLSPESLKRWGVCKSVTTGDWLVPGYGADGKLNQLYRYINKVLYPTPELSHHLHGVNLYDPAKPTVYFCEGVWDGIALWEILSKTKMVEDKYVPTSNEDVSLLNKINVLASPGANVFQESWLELFAGKNLTMFPDSDHEKVVCRDCKKSYSTTTHKCCPTCKKVTIKPVIAPAGYAGLRRNVETISKGEDHPSSVSYLNWGVKGFDENLPSGYDVRDFLTTNGATVALRAGRLQGLIQKVVPIHAEWIPGKTKDKETDGSVDMDILPCDNWKDLRNAWLKAMKWTEGLDRGLSVMLASITSTETVGDQAWVKIIGPASCLHGSTIIYDPIDGSRKTVKQRYLDGVRFYVTTLKGDNQVGVAQALPPQKYNPQTMWKLNFASGRSLIVTGGHKLKSADGYVSVADLLKLEEAIHLPTISGISLNAHIEGVLCEKKRELDSQYGYPHDCNFCDEPLQTGEDSHLCDPPLQNDVHRSYRSYVCKDDSLEPSLGGILQKDHHEIADVPHHVLSSQSEGGSQLSSALDNDEQRVLKSCEQLQLQQQTHLDYKFQLKSQYEPQSSDIYSQHRSQIESDKFYSDLYLVEKLSHIETVLVHKVPSIDQSYLEANHDVSQVCSLPQIVSSNDVLLLNQLETPCNTEPAYDQTGNTDTRGQSSLETTDLTEPSFITPIRVFDITLGQLNLAKTDKLVSIEYAGQHEYYDFSVPETQNYWSEGFFHHNCGKSTLCEAISVNKKYVKALSTIRGFHSGYMTDKEGKEDHSLISKLKNKTLVTKDGDTLLQSPNLGQILSEARDIYDRTSRSDYRNSKSSNYEGINMTWILCGTSSLRSIDSSELGERFIDCVMMEGIDDELEDMINERVIHRVIRNMKGKNNGTSSDDPDMIRAKQLTGGYIDHLRKNADDLLSQLEFPNEAIQECKFLGKFVAYMRARPSRSQDETAEREFSSRLVSQHGRIAMCLAVVLSKKSVDTEVMRRVKQVALDTARGVILDICTHLYRNHEDGLSPTEIALHTSQTDTDVRKRLRFLKRIGVADFHKVKAENSLRGKVKWKLTSRLYGLYELVMKPVQVEE